MQGIIKLENGTGRKNWLIQPLEEGSSSVLINWEDGQHLTEDMRGVIVEYIVEQVKMGTSTFTQARITKILYRYINKGFQRNLDIYEEAKRRLELWLKQESFYDLFSDDRMEFEFLLALYEFPYLKEEWMGEDFNQFITEDENDSDVVQYILDKLFYDHLHLLPKNHRHHKILKIKKHFNENKK
jgi:hypothetical protein